jgi:uncharacterized phage-like protein YoqJ
MIVAFTGHRPNKLGGYQPCSTADRVIARVREKLLELKPTAAISGMALGFDQWSAEVCLELEIPFIAAVAFPGQELEWPWYSQQRYYTLIKKASQLHLVDLERPHTRWEAAQKLHARNHWMVDHSDAIVAAWNGTPGGTAECVKYARKVGCPVYQIGQWSV